MSDYQPAPRIIRQLSLVELTLAVRGHAFGKCCYSLLVSASPHQWFALSFLRVASSSLLFSHSVKEGQQESNLLAWPSPLSVP